MLSKVPPHDLESEFSVIGAVLAHHGAYDAARNLLESSDFYRPVHAAIFCAVGDLLRRGSSHESILSQLVASKVEGPLALSELMDSACAPGNVSYHAKRVLECSGWRAQIVAAQRAQEDLWARAATRAPQGRLPDPLEIVDGHDVASMTRDAERALLVRRAPVFHRGGQLVRIRRSRGSASLEALPAPSLLEMLSENASWVRHTADGPKRVKPPKVVVDGLLARGTWSLREVHTLAEAPCLSAQGRVLSREGWDESGVFVSLDPDRKYPGVPDAPTVEDARQALASLYVAFGEFPFVDETDLAAAFALVLTLVARPAIDGSVPLFAVRGPVAGSGKGLVVHVASACAFGRLAAVSPPERDPSEERKSLLALGAEGAPLALIDNLEHALGSDVLAAALTAPTFRARELGKTRTLEVKLPVLCATGNNLQIKGDLARRCVPIDIDPKTEQPEGRVFQREQPAWALENHPGLVSAALTVLRAFSVAGKPQPAGVKPYGSFEPWSRLVRSALIWAGTEDPCGGRARLREEADTGLAELEALMNAWVDCLPPRSSASDAITKSVSNDALRDSLVSIVGGDPRKLTPKRVTWALKMANKRIVRALRFVSVVERGVTFWTVESTDPSKPLPPPTQASVAEDRFGQ